MLYLRRTFTCPAGPQNVSEEIWDLAMLSREEFKQKYDASDEEYDEITAGNRNA